ncbi:MAG TPA: peptide chain release factor N(5)-glutamine methyltransferase [Candidatus Brocadiia bacterium]|nr:peptide chain release factor N(5)-glutamine methyltransferase [Candidatus Brocadiia bacterium]
MAAEEQAVRDSEWTILRLLQWTAQHFRKAGIETARLDAEILLAHVLSTDRIHLYTGFDRVVGDEERARFRELVKRRAQRVPCKWLTGKAEFYGIPLDIEEGVFVPRPETELLVQCCLELAKPAESEWRVLELCAGSGAVAIAIAAKLPNARITAVEMDGRAAALAERNCRKNAVDARVKIVLGDLFAPLTEADRADGFDFVLANPPYVASSMLDELDPEVALHEPRLAWDGGADGLDYYEKIIGQAGGLLRKGGILIVEMGEGQSGAVTRIAEKAGFARAAIRRDAAKIERVAILGLEG